MNNQERIIKLRQDRILGREEMKLLLTTLTKEEEQFLYETAAKPCGSRLMDVMFICGD